jgi:hypothetical protein
MKYLGEDRERELGLAIDILENCKMQRGQDGWRQENSYM